MEEKEGLNGSGITVKGDEAPQSYRVEPRVENSSQFGGSTAPPTQAAPVSVAPPSSELKKKREGQETWKQSSGRPVDSFKKKHKLEFGSAGRTMSAPVGGSFTPHMITVNAGEDIMMKIISFSQQGSRAICILAANGAISNVTLRQPNSSGGTLTYEVVIGSFLPGVQQEQKPKKPKYEQTISFAPAPANPISEERYEAAYNGPKPNLTTSVNSMHGSKISDPEINVSLPGEDSRERNHEITC
ncbi:UNVERIFIED_CONTAM: AT-hook motif nuclear-localized protein 1 [Sesamum calycinum]|uniref:AT-hook motif nuclear-localized protein n=1 Tax=Sesamum calycinum TaxID=2727403 RepID=A0AAW2QUY4_9LAMI